jgi:uncharacterized protein
MDSSAEVPIPYRIIALMQERNRLFAYSLQRLAADIKSIGFQCTHCGECCTRTINSHIFLLDHDVTELKKIDPAAYEPAPDPEFCDQYGTLYVSGYALRIKCGNQRSCWFLDSNQCRIYDQRFSCCRIYPHMLHRNVDPSGHVAWQQFARPNEHGDYSRDIPDDECLTLAREIKEYENAFLSQQIYFLETVHEYFTAHNLRDDREARARCRERYLQGAPVTVMVYRAGELEENRISKND